MVAPNLFFFFPIPPPAIFLKPAIQTTGCLPYAFFTFWQHSRTCCLIPWPTERQQSPGQSASAYLEGCHTSLWHATFHSGSSESAKGSPAISWQDLLLLNLFSQPVTELCAVWISGPNASFNSLLLMEMLGSGKQNWLWN